MKALRSLSFQRKALLWPTSKRALLTVSALTSLLWPWPAVPMDKRQVYDWDTRIHLLARGPGIAKGASFELPATQVDVAPTFLGLAGVQPPPDMDGKSLLPHVRGALFFQNICAACSLFQIICISGSRFPDQNKSQDVLRLKTDAERVVSAAAARRQHGRCAGAEHGGAPARAAAAG